MGIKALGYLVITTAKPEEWDRFLTQLVGVMKADGGEGGVSLYRLDDRPFRFWIQKGGEERLTAAAYELSDGAAYDALKARIEAAGRPVEDGSEAEASARCVKAFFRTRDPDGNGFEFYHGDARDSVEFVSPAGVSGFVTGEMGMGHAVFCAPNFDATHGFHKNVVGFGDTDFPRFHFTDDPNDPGMGFAFMHADNGRHHSIALAEMPIPPSGCVHIMLEMKSMDDVGKCLDRMKAAKVPESATLGRHVNDRTFGFYMQTPGGFDIEIGWDPIVIDWQNWETTAHLVPSEWGHEWAWQKALAEPA